MSFKAYPPFEVKITSALELEQPGSPYRWVALRDRGALTIPSVDRPTRYLFANASGTTIKYDTAIVDPKTPIGSILTYPFTHWFSKPLDFKSRDWHDGCMDRLDLESDHVYLVRWRDAWCTELIRPTEQTDAGLHRFSEFAYYWVEVPEVFPIGRKLGIG